MKSVYQIILVIVLSLFSFFYTNKVISFIRDTDPIMKNIKKYDKKNKVKAVNAKVSDKRIVPGIVGKEVDKVKSFNKMKKYGVYNESLTVFKEVKPAISIDDYYDRYIQEGSGINNDVSLVFEVKDRDDISEILKILNQNNVNATFFVDGLWLENNREYVEKLVAYGNELEILSYDNKYDELYFSSSLNIANTITNLKPKYCYARYDQKEVLNLCKKLGLHTVIPTILTGNYPYNDIKTKIYKGAIIGFRTNASVNIELDTIIKYIKQKGFVIDTLDNLLSEAGNIK